MRESGPPPEGTERFVSIYERVAPALEQYFAAAVTPLEPEVRQEKKEEPARVFRYEGNPDKPRVLFTIKMIGPLNAMLPVIRELQKRGATIFLRISGDALERKHDGRDALLSECTESSDAEVATTPPQVIVRTTTDPARFDTQDISEDAEESYRAQGARVVYFEDYPGNVGKIRGKKQPDLVLTMTDQAADGARARFPDAAVRPTGRPDFDSYADEKIVAQNREAGRAELGIAKDEFLVVFSWQLPPSTLTALRKFATALRGIDTKGKKLVFCYSKHPGFTAERYPGALEAIEEILSDVESAGVRVVRQGSVSTERLGCAADLLVNTHATEGLASVHRGVSTLYIGIPNDAAHAHHYEESRPDGAYPPPVEAEAAFWIPDDADDAETQGEIEAAIHNDAERKEKQDRGRESFHADGQATVRVADALEELVPQQGGAAST